MSNLARVYAKTLFALSSEESLQAVIAKDLEEVVAGIGESPQARELLYKFPLGKPEKKALLGAALMPEDSPLLWRFLMVLIDNDSLHLLEPILKAYKECLHDYLGIVVGTLYSPVALTAAQIEKLSLLFSKQLGKEVRLRLELDLDLIGGYRVELAGKVYDNSLQMQLQEMKKHLMGGEPNVH